MNPMREMMIHSSRENSSREIRMTNGEDPDGEEGITTRREMIAIWTGNYATIGSLRMEETNKGVRMCLFRRERVGKIEVEL